MLDEDEVQIGNSIYQLYHELPKVQGRVIQTSSWVIGGMAAGINFREAKAGTIFGDMSPFLPHIVYNSGVERMRDSEFELYVKLNKWQKELSESIYGSDFW